MTPSKDATFDGVSEDTINPTSWKTVEQLKSGETNGSIFTKISNMFSNMRYLINRLGNTDFSEIGETTVSAALVKIWNTKPSLEHHTHTVADLPVSSNQVNSSDYIPSSSLVYSMYETINNILKTCTETLSVNSSGIITTTYKYPIAFGYRDYSGNVWFVPTGNNTYKCWTYSSGWIGSTITTVSSGTSITVSYLYCPLIQ